MRNIDFYPPLRTVLDSYIHETPITKSNLPNQDDEEIISLDSDDDNIPLKSDDVTTWYSNFLKCLERQYPDAFDHVVKSVMTGMPGRRRNALRNVLGTYLFFRNNSAIVSFRSYFLVLGFLLKMSCVNNDTNIFENLYHHNSTIRSEAVAYLVQNFASISLRTDNDDILKLTVTERLIDENPIVVSQVLKIPADQLVHLIGADELVAKSSNILMRFWKSPEKWLQVVEPALTLITSSGVHQCSDPNIVLIALLPFLIPANDMKYVNTIRKSNLAKVSDFFRNLPKKETDPSKFSLAVAELLTKRSGLSSSESVLNTVTNLLVEKKRLGTISVHFAFYILASSIESMKPSEFGLKVIQVMSEILEKTELKMVDGNLMDTFMLKSNEIPIQLLTLLLRRIIESTRFEGSTLNFMLNDDETRLKKEIFTFLVDKFYTSEPPQRAMFNDVIKVFLNTICDSNHVLKLKFFSQFCGGHVVNEGFGGIDVWMQVRVMRLLNHILAHNQEHVADYPDEIFQNILMSLSAESPVIREMGSLIVETLHQQKIQACWKFIFEKLHDRQSEIILDSEQLSLMFYLTANKKSSKHASTVINGITDRIKNPTTFYYIKYQLLHIIKHLTERKVLEMMSEVALKLIQDAGDASQRFEEHRSDIMKLILLKINSDTITNFWNLALASLKCHYLMDNEDCHYLTPSILVLKAIDEGIFKRLHPDHRIAMFQEIVSCAMAQHGKIVQAAQKIFHKIDVDSKVVTTILKKMPMLEMETGRKKATAPLQLMNPLSSVEWKRGVALLELLQNKTRGFLNQHELVQPLFDVLDNSLRRSDSNVEYARQIILSLLLTICQKVSPDGQSHREIGLLDTAFRTDLVIKCIRESQNPQTHHHSLLLLAHLGLMTPEQVLHDIMTIFTFVGTTVVRHDDSYSFQIIAKIIENIIPTLIHRQGKSSDEEVVPVLKVFAAIILDVPEHRRMMLYVKLLQTLGQERFLWTFIAVLMESQVMNHQRGAEQEDLPQRLQVGLAIAKEFDVKTILESSSSVIEHLMTLPMYIEPKTTRPGQADIEKSIFSAEAHTDVQLRHFKYLMTQFLKHLLSSPEISVKVMQLDTDETMKLKGQFQSIILSTLKLISDFNKSMENQRMKQFEKSWRVIQQITFDVLEASIGLLAPDILLVVVQNLMLHEHLPVRKKVIELLNRKLDADYFENVDDRKLLKVLEPLREIIDTIIDKDNANMESVQQSALISIKFMARKLAEENPDEFVEILKQLTSVMNNEAIKTPVMMNIVISIAELTSNLKVRAISMLGRFMPHILKLLTVQNDDAATFTLLYSVVSALLKIIETVPLFLSPYLIQMIQQLVKLCPGLKLLQDKQITAVMGKVGKIWITLAQFVPSRVLIPAVEEVYDRILQKFHYQSIEPLMELMYQIFTTSDSKDVKSMQADATEFFLKAMQFRNDISGKIDIEFEEINEVELFIIRALVGLTMKLSEGSFRPLFESIVQWAIKDEPENYNRAITFFRLTNEVSVALQSLFLLFSSDLVDSAGPMLNKCNPAKENDQKCFADDSEKNLYLTQFILRTLHNIFLYDHQNFINTHRFDIVMQPIVDQIENADILKNESMIQLLRLCIAQLAVAASDDILWKQLNYQVLLKTRSDDPEIRILGLKICVDMAKKLGEDFEPLVPETIPFLSELLEDENYKVVEACQAGVRELELTVGESLQKYF